MGVRLQEVSQAIKDKKWSFEDHQGAFYTYKGKVKWNTITWTSLQLQMYQDTLIEVILETKSFNAVKKAKPLIAELRQADSLFQAQIAEDTVIFYFRTMRALSLNQYRTLLEGKNRVFTDEVSGSAFGENRKIVLNNFAELFHNMTPMGDNRYDFRDVLVGGYRYEQMSAYFRYNPLSNRDELVSVTLFSHPIPSQEKNVAFREFESLMLYYGGVYGEGKTRNGRGGVMSYYVGTDNFGNYTKYPIVMTIDRVFTMTGEELYQIVVQYY